MAITSELIAGAQAVLNAIGVPASVVLAQYFLESGDRPDKPGGSSTLASEYNNYFGIKGKGTAGTVKLPTTEYYNGVKTTVTDNFAVYETAEDGIIAYAKVLTNGMNSPYLEGAITVEDYVKGIHESPYATDVSYDDKLNSLISKYNLTQYDTEYKLYNRSGLSGLSVSDAVIPDSGDTVTSQTGWKDSAESFAVDYIAEPLTTTIFVILFAVLAVVFFMRAFPVTTQAVDTVKSYTTKRKKGSEA